MTSQSKNSTIILDLGLIASKSDYIKNDKTIPLEAPVFELLSWWSLVFCLARRSHLSFELVLFKPHFPSSVHWEEIAKHWPVRWANGAEHNLNSNQTFSYLSSSQTLTGKILDQFNHVHVRPAGLPEILSNDQFWYTAGGSTWITELRAVLDEAFPGQWFTELNDLESKIKPSNSSITAISSIFNGDDFLKGFLENTSNWNNYDTCEHLLIRAGSNGQEHDTLNEYVNKHPNAVYINLENDPGLYEVWNMGVRLSTAPYLTNANIDDQRAPQQVSSLTEFLHKQPYIDVVSTKLRVTHTPDMTWEDSDKCSIMFTHEPTGSYKVDRLFRYETGNAVSRNLPHCMPVWRRYLHNNFGFFNEERYGPSADWEFWLRTGISETKFSFLTEPIGLYLQHEQSYWHREKLTDFDQLIVDKYAFFVKNKISFNRAAYPLSQRIDDVLRAHTIGDGLPMLSGLVDCVLRSRKPETDNNAQELINKVASRSLKFNDFSHFLDMHLGAFISMEDPLENALSLAIELLHSQTFNSNVQWVRIIEKALVDHFILTNSISPLVCLAFLHHKLGNYKSENNILESTNELDPVGFWSEITRVYRFEVDLDELTANFSSITTRLNLTSPEPSKLKIWFYPVYSSNKYTRLLYEDIVKQNGIVEGITNLHQFDQINPDPNCMNVVHIHWINEFVDGVNGSFPEKKAQYFLSQLQRLKEKGFELRWTIHNRLSHQSTDASKEVNFRRTMYDIADRVYLHHPMAVHLLDWINDNGKKCSLVEHGHYLSLFGPKINRKKARNQLDFKKDDFVMLHLGLLRDYKGLNDLLPVIKRVSKTYPHFKFVIAGRIDSPEVRHSLDAAQCPNIIINEAFLSDSEIDLYTSAVDIGFLSYKSILTSGTLFHLISGGLPVIGPNIGTIPAYIAKGWNGFLYEDSNKLEDILMHCCKLPRSSIKEMSNNALRLATSLEWKYF